MDPQLECCICMSEIKRKDYTITECRHTFHSSCILKSCYNNGFTCPMCRFVFEGDKDNNMSIRQSNTHNTSIIFNFTDISNVCIFYFIIYLILMNILIVDLIRREKTIM